MKIATASYKIIFSYTHYLFFKIIPVVVDKVAIDPDTRKRVLFGILIKRKGAVSAETNINAPNMMAWFFGDISKVSPEAA